MLPSGFPPASGLYLRSGPSRPVPGPAGRACRQRGKGVLVAAPSATAGSSLSNGTARLRSSGRDSVLSLSQTPTASTMTKWVFAAASGRHGLQVGRRDHPRAPALHLLEVDLRLHVAHEDQALQRLDVGAGGDHVHGDGDARVVASCGSSSIRSSGFSPVVR